MEENGSCCCEAVTQLPEVGSKTCHSGRRRKGENLTVSERVLCLQSCITLQGVYCKNEAGIQRAVASGDIHVLCLFRNENIVF